MVPQSPDTLRKPRIAFTAASSSLLPQQGLWEGRPGRKHLSAAFPVSAIPPPPSLHVQTLPRAAHAQPTRRPLCHTCWNWLDTDKSKSWEKTLPKQPQAGPQACPPRTRCSPHADTSVPPGSAFPKGGKLLCCLISCCCLIPRAEKTSHSHALISSQVQTLGLSPRPRAAGTPHGSMDARGSGPGRGASRAAAPAARGMHHIRKARDHRRLPGTFPSPRARHALRLAAKEMNSHFLPCRCFS